MPLYAVIARYCKRWGYTILIVMVLAGCGRILNPRLHSSLLLSDAKAYWQSRDLTQSSFNRILSNLDSHPFIVDFPAISTIPYDYATEFYSKNGSGLDLILEKDDATALINSLNIGKVEVNQLKSVRKNDKNWIICLFDSSTAKAANGYYYEQKDIVDKYWVSIFEYN